MATDDLEVGGNATNIFLWVLQVIGAVVFCLVGVAKIVGTEGEMELFRTLGWGQWFRFLTGGLELMGAAMLLFPAGVRLGAVLLALVMAGATMAHLMVLHTSPTLPMTLLVMMAIVALGRHKKKVHHPEHHPLPRHATPLPHGK